MFLSSGLTIKLSTYNLQFRKGTKGPKLILDGFSYFRNNSNSERTYWLCSRNRYHKCKSRLITSNTTKELIIKNQNHNHGPDSQNDNSEILTFDEVMGFLNDLI